MIKFTFKSHFDATIGDNMIEEAGTDSSNMDDNEDTLGFEKVVEFNKRKHKVEGVRYCKSNLLCRVKQELSL